MGRSGGDLEKLNNRMGRSGGDLEGVIGWVFPK